MFFCVQERRRNAVLEERRTQELSSKPTLPEDNFKKSAMKSMGATVEGDVVFGSNDEINLDSQVFFILLSYLVDAYYFLQLSLTCLYTNGSLGVLVA